MISGVPRRPTFKRASALPITTEVFHRWPARRHLSARARDGFSQNWRTARTGPVVTVAEVLPGLDPPVLDFGLGGLSAEEDDAGRMRIDPGPHLRDMGHEHVITGNVVVRGEDGDRRVGIPPGDLGGRREDGCGRPAVRGLSEDVRMRGTGELLRDVLGVPLHRDDDRPVDGEANPDPVEGLAEQRTASEDRHVLLRALIAEGGADEGPETHALSSGQHDGPEVHPRASRRRRALRREGALLPGDRRRLAHGGSPIWRVVDTGRAVRAGLERNSDARRRPVR